MFFGQSLPCFRTQFSQLCVDLRTGAGRGGLAWAWFGRAGHIPIIEALRVAVKAGRRGAFGLFGTVAKKIIGGKVQNVG